MGSRAADLVKKSEPVLEKGLTMYEQGKFTPGFNPVSEAMKPKGGNWASSVASPDLPLAQQGDIGEYFSKSLVDPTTLWFKELPNTTKRAFAHFLEDNYNITNFQRFKDNPTYFKDQADAFVLQHNQTLFQNQQMAPGIEHGQALKSTDDFVPYADEIGRAHV